jgi:hypothetical protein
LSNWHALVLHGVDGCLQHGLLVLHPFRFHSFFRHFCLDYFCKTHFCIKYPYKWKENGNYNFVYF